MIMKLFESEDERLLNKAVTVLKALKKGVLKIDVQKKKSQKKKLVGKMTSDLKSIKMNTR